MADSGPTDFAQGDSLWSLTRKILSRLNQGITTSGGGGGGGGGGAVTMADGANVTQGAKADAANTDSTSSWSVISLLKGIWAKLNGGVAVTGTLTAVTSITNPVTVTQGTAANLKVDLSGTAANATAIKVDASGVAVPVTNAGLSNIDVALSTRLKPADTLTAVTTVGTITNPVTVTQGTASSLKVDLSGSGALANVTTVGTVSTLTSGNVGGFTFGTRINPTISTSAYSAGFTVGGIQTLTNAVRVSGGTGILESLIVTDTSNQKAAFDIFIFESNPAAATTTDHAAFTFSTDIAKVIAHISVAAADYVSVGSTAYAIATESGLGIALKANGSQNLYAVVVTSGTPTYGTTTALQFTWGILQD